MGQVKELSKDQIKHTSSTLQAPICSYESFACVKAVQETKLGNSNCLAPCSGLILTSFSKSVGTKNFGNKICSCYLKYTKWSPFPHELQGKIEHHNIEEYNYVSIIDYEWKNRMRYVRIYFDTPTFDRITKDRAAKFVDMLSAIGGTMGLLTGVSIISLVEIGYFTVKFIIDVWKIK